GHSHEQQSLAALRNEYLTDEIILDTFKKLLTARPGEPAKRSRHDEDVPTIGGIEIEIEEV
ncbi:hypothetical protein Alg130_10552, partial [Pyrenophora tritici-repentis]